MTTHEVLMAAKGYLLKYGWQRDSYGDEGFPTCAAGALFHVAVASGDNHPARLALAAAAGVETERVALWNDRVSFTEVIDAYDRAIRATAPKDTPEPSPSVTHVFA